MTDYRRVELDRIRISSRGLRIADPRWLSEPNLEGIDMNVPEGVFPVLADVVSLPEGQVVGAVYVVFDEARFREAEMGRRCEKLDSVAVESGAIALVDPKEVAVRPGTLGEQYDTSPTECGWASTSLLNGRGIAVTAGFGAGQYGVWSWYGSDVAERSHHDIAALGVVTLSERDPVNGKLAPLHTTHDEPRDARES
ncbi:MAG: hypothetical protein QM784_23015 [Polyangiaceae bacterium]